MHAQTDKVTDPALDAALAFTQTWLDHWFPHAGIPGVSLAVRQHGDLILSRAWGEANIIRHEKLTPQHLFRVASHSKMFTATALGILQDRHLLKFEDELRTLLPWTKKSKTLGNLALWHLLSHTSGLPRNIDGMDYWETAYPDSHAFQEMTLKSKLVPVPRGSIKYSNVGYGILGAVIEAVSGQPYADFIKDNIIDPLGLQQTYPDITKMDLQNLVTGYDFSRAAPENRPAFDSTFSTKALAAANEIISTPADITLFLSQQSGKKQSVLSVKTHKDLCAHFRNVAENSAYAYGLGYERLRLKNHVFTGHSGSYPGQQTQSFYNKNLDLAASVFVNEDGPHIENIMQTLLTAITFHLRYKLSGKTIKSHGDYFDPGTYYRTLVHNNHLHLFSFREDNPYECVEKFKRIEKDRYLIKNEGSFGSENEEIIFKKEKGRPVMRYGQSLFKKI